MDLVLNVGSPKKLTFFFFLQNPEIERVLFRFPDSNQDMGDVDWSGAASKLRLEWIP